MESVDSFYGIERFTFALSTCLCQQQGYTDFLFNIVTSLLIVHVGVELLPWTNSWIFCTVLYISWKKSEIAVKKTQLLGCFGCWEYKE